MQESRPQFSLRMLILVVALVAIALAMLRGGSKLRVPLSNERELSGDLLVFLGANLLFGTVGGAIGGFGQTWRAVVMGALAAILFAWAVLLLYAPNAL